MAGFGCPPRIVERLLAARGFEGRSELCDTDPAVLDEIQRHVSEGTPVELRATDGFAAARASEADLYLIDPFASWSASARLADELADKNVLVWYGIVANGQPDRLVERTGLLGFEVLWSQIHQNRSPTQRGCGLLLSKPLQGLLPALLADAFDAARRLGWQLHLRQPWSISISRSEVHPASQAVGDESD